MITGGFDFIAVLLGLCALLVWVEHIGPPALFKWFPSIVLVMFGSMTLYTLGAWEMTDDVRAARATVRDNSIPAMLFLMSLRSTSPSSRSWGRASSLFVSRRRCPSWSGSSSSIR